MVGRMSLRGVPWKEDLVLGKASEAQVRAVAL